ncbi:MAG: hypothetical protein A4E45_00721 [Methanosaeta sp. PtaB.Bin039]|nr:MAG: hypothetical protein A4E45_00721 [Methanosaeta sp. PtaB.Bin039]
MKKAMSNVDVLAMVAELSERLVGGFVGKAYQVSGDAVWLTVQSPQEGRLDLLLEAGKRLHITTSTRQSKKTPPQFPTILRSHLSGGRIVAVEQYDLDRVVRIVVERGDGRRFLVAELFPKGNLLLLDQDELIILPLRPMAFRGRKLLAGEKYVYHAGQQDPRTASSQYLANLLATSDSDLVRTLVRGLNMGGVYGEEVCLVSGIDKGQPAASLSPDQVEAVRSALAMVFSQTQASPRIVLKDGTPFDVTPFPLRVYQDLESREFPRLSQALDEFFALEAPAPQPSPLKRREELQRRAVQEFAALEREMAGKGEGIYERYSEVEAILSVVAQARSRGFSYREIGERIKGSDHPAASTIKSIDYRGLMVVTISGMELELDAGLTVPQNAERYYQRSKEAGRKMAGAEVALHATEELGKGKEQVRRRAQSWRRPRPKWYERFRWFHSSDGLLVIGGRDSDDNEEIYAKYLEKRDLAMHTDYPGAPLTVIKTEGQHVSESTLEEAAQFAVSYSNLWKGGLGSGDCYLVGGEQVTKTPESGEALRKGAFVIRGERRYFRGVSLGVALALLRDRLIGGPISAIRSQAEDAGSDGEDRPLVMEIEPGELSPDDLARRIYRGFLELDMDRRTLKAVASVEQIVSFLPPGGSRIKDMRDGQ